MFQALGNFMAIYQAATKHFLLPVMQMVMLIAEYFHSERGQCLISSV
jgi:hypothetical protein